MKGKDTLHPIPKACPVTGEKMYVSELTSEESGVVIRGRFAMPESAELSDEQKEFLTVFLRARGVISTIEKELGISYPTVRNRIDALLHDMGLEPYKGDRRTDRAEEKAKILKQLEEGEISAAEAKEQLKKVGAK
ncbi:MAG: DUF2089 domain-containing protein [Armatimonadetes bacterium]|nr:DUF2089 domain-containing protein [Armatimonadota bacterium]MBS1712414.1 DUF2089 domain-containing protein [Armatimonadota bacterium]MBX3109277.1 DUF2089 domain-containing protein [Fimbriimonadaceae bacterium]